MNREALKRQVKHIETKLDRRQNPFVIIVSSVTGHDGVHVFADTYICDGLPGMAVTRQPGEGNEALLERAEAEFIDANRGRNLALVIRPEENPCHTSH